MARKMTARLHLLTPREVQAAEDGDHGDGGGLLLRVRGDSASWVFRFTSPGGRRREMGLGVALRGSLKQAGETLTAARDAAHAARELVRHGSDPIDTRDARREQARQNETAQRQDRARERRTLAWCARDYHARVIEPNRTTKHAAQWIASLENHMPAALWRSPIEDVDAPSLLAALSAVQPHERARNIAADARLSETVSRLRQRLDAVFEDALFHGWCTANPAAAIRRKLREALPETKAAQLRALPYAEAPALLQRLRQMPGTAARCLEFAVLTCARTSEALTAAWADVDLAARTWTVPAERMKAGEAHTVYLSARAVEIVRGQLGLDDVLLFPSTMSGYEGRPQSNMAMSAVLDRLGARDRTTVHGLCRATFSTWANETGTARPDVVEACLAHSESDRVRRAYNRAEFVAERRKLLERWAAFLNTARALRPRQ